MCSHGFDAFENIARLAANVPHRSLGVLSHVLKDPGLRADRAVGDPPLRAPGVLPHHHRVLFSTSGDCRLLIDRRAHKGGGDVPIDNTMIVSWWLMEWACRCLWLLYPPDVEFHQDHRVDPIQVAMALHPTNWGHFVAYSLWLVGHTPDFSERVVVYKTLLHWDPQFIPCFYALLGRWLLSLLWPPEKTKEEDGLCRPVCTQHFGWVAPLFPGPESESFPGPRHVAQRVGLHLALTTPSTLSDGPRDSPQHRSTMGGRLGGDATLLA